MTRNYQHVLEKQLQAIACSGTTPRLLLHSCCGPCSTSVLEYLSGYFDITILYYNPNIYPHSEFIKRADEQRKLLSCMVTPHPVELIVDTYDPAEFDTAANGLEHEPEGGTRCLRCFELRLFKTAARAKELGFDMFTTTLSVSPHKNAEAINTLCEAAAAQFDVSYLYADFKKKDGYKRSIELSRLYDLYRQDYCGCRYSYESNRDKPDRQSI